MFLKFGIKLFEIKLSVLALISFAVFDLELVLRENCGLLEIRDKSSSSWVENVKIFFATRNYFDFHFWMFSTAKFSNLSIYLIQNKVKSFNF